MNDALGRLDCTAPFKMPERFAANRVVGLDCVVVYLFLQVDRRAGYLLIPYGLWVAYAAVLNFSIRHLN